MFKKSTVVSIVIIALSILLTLTISGCSSKAAITAQDTPAPKVAKPTSSDIVGAWNIKETGDTVLFIFNGEIDKAAKASVINVLISNDDKTHIKYDAFYNIEDKGNDVYLLTTYKMQSHPWTPELGDGNVAPLTKGDVIFSATLNFKDKDTMEFASDGHISTMNRIKMEMGKSMYEVEKYSN